MFLTSPRLRDSHKGDYGVVLCVGGSRGMSGAISLCAHAAIRAGAGLVRVAIPDCCLETVASYAPEYTTIPLPHTPRGLLSRDGLSTIAEEAARADVVAIGPGIGRSEETTSLVAELYRTLPQPMIVDADALNALASLDSFPESRGMRILTPHTGEFRRLIASNKEFSAKETLQTETLQEVAQLFAQKHNLILVLKGSQTFVASHNSTWQNEKFGNAGMATGGAGDCLTGIMASLWGQKICAAKRETTDDAAKFAFATACAAVTLHAISGDCAAESLGEESLTASALIDFLPNAFRKWRCVKY